MPRRRPAVLGRHGRHGHRRLPQAPVPRRRRSLASGIPGFAFSDGPRGVVVGNATCFPVTMARGATWDVDLEERIGEAIGRELRAVGADLYGGVCVNALRHPAWGRAQETYGEDPHHLGELGAALTRGAQRHVMATLKHFACNSMENARFAVDVTVDEVALHEVYLPHFKRIVDEGVACVMSAYNAVNGEWCGQSRDPPHRHPPRRVGLRRLRDQRLDLRPPRRRTVDHRGARRRDAGPHDPPRRPRLRPSGPSTSPRPTSTPASPAPSRRCSGTPLMLTATRRPLGPEVLAAPAHQALAREAAAKAVVLLQNEPVDGRAVLPIDPGVAAGRGARPPRRRAQPRRRGFQRRLRAHPSSPCSTGSGPRSPTPRSSTPTAPTWRRPPPRRPAPTWRSSWSATPEPTRASSSATAAPPTCAPCSPVPTSPRWWPPSRPGSRAIGCAIEGSVPGSDALGFSTGGDRERLTLHDADEAAHRGRRRRQPAHRRLPRGRQRRADRGVAPPGPRPRPDLVLGDAGRARHRRCADRRRRRDGTAALHGRRRRRPPPSVRPRRDRGRPTTPGTATGASPAIGTSPPSRSASASRTRHGSRARPRSTTTAMTSSCGPQLTNTGERAGADVVQVYAGRPADSHAAGAATGGLRARRGRRRSQRRGRAAHPVVAAGGPGSRPPRVGARGPGPMCSPSVATAPT